MAYGRPPWAFDDWPSVWVFRSLAMLEEMAESPDGQRPTPEPTGWQEALEEQERLPAPP
jgi:hypothetical protein